MSVPITLCRSFAGTMDLRFTKAIKPRTNFVAQSVRGCRPVGKAPPLPPSRQWMIGEAKFFYELERDPRFHALRDRLIIDWGKGALAFVQKLQQQTRGRNSESR